MHTEEDTVDLESLYWDITGSFEDFVRIIRRKTRNQSDAVIDTLQTGLFRFKLWSSRMNIEAGSLKVIETDSNRTEMLLDRLQKLELVLDYVVSFVLTSRYVDNPLKGIQTVSLSQNVADDDSDEDVIIELEDCSSEPDQNGQDHNLAAEIQLQTLQYLHDALSKSIGKLFEITDSLMFFVAAKTKQEGFHADVLRKIESLEHQISFPDTLSSSSVTQSHADITTSPDLLETTPTVIDKIDIPRMTLPSSLSIPQTNQATKLEDVVKRVPGLKKERQVNDAPLNLLGGNFQGRKLELERMESALRKDYSNMTQCVLFGPTEAGKTHLALWYAKQALEQDPTLSLFWLSARDENTVTRGSENLLKLLSPKPKFAGFRHEARIQAARRRLESFGALDERRWVLIVDDVRMGSWQILSKLVPQAGIGGKIIFTTREDHSRSWLTQTFRQASVIMIRPFPDVSSSVQALLPFVDITGSTDQSVSLDISADIFQSTTEESKRLLAKYLSPLTSDSTRRLFCSQLLEHLGQRLWTAKVLLMLLAFYEPDNIPLGIFQEHLDRRPSPGDDNVGVTSTTSSGGSGKKQRRSTIVKKLRRLSKATPESSPRILPQRNPEHSITNVQDVLRMFNESDDLQAAIELLCGHGFIGIRSGVDIKSDAYDYVKIHDLLSDHILLGLNGDDFTVFFRSAVIMVVKPLEIIGQRLNDPSTWHMCAKLIPHLQNLRHLSDTRKIPDQRLETALAQLGWYYHSRGQYKEAENCCIRALNTLPEQSKGMVREWLARVHLKQDEFEKAEVEFESLLPQASADCTGYSEEKLVIAEGLATSYYLSGKLRKAETLYQKILERRNELSDVEDYQKAKLWEGLANTYQRLGRPEDAQREYARSLAFQKRELGPRYVKMLGTIYNQARLFRDQNKFTDAIRLLVQVKQDMEDLQGEEHPDTLLASARLAYTYSRADDLHEGLQLAKNTLKKQQLLQDDLPKAGMYYTCWVLAGIYTKSKEFEIAERYFKQALQGYTKELKEKHPFTLAVRRDMSDMYQSKGNLDEAVLVLKKAEKYIEGTEGAAKLARLYDHQKHFDKALKLAEDTKEIQRRERGNNTAEINYTLWVIARIYAHKAKASNSQEYNDEAKRHYLWAFEGYSRIPGSVYCDRAELATEIAVFLGCFPQNKHYQKTLRDLMPKLKECGYDENKSDNEKWGPSREILDHFNALLGPDRAPPDNPYDDVLNFYNIVTGTYPEPWVQLQHVQYKPDQWSPRSEKGFSI